MAVAAAYGVSARQVGLSWGQAELMSLGVFAGAAQLSALQVWPHAGAGVVLLITLIVNLRYLLLGASIAPYLREEPMHRRALAAFTLSDESYGLAMARFANGHGSFSYLLGANLGLYVQWNGASLVGALAGTALPELGNYRPDLLFPLAFLGLLVPLVTDRVRLAVALVSGGLALGAAMVLPGKWYILVAGAGASTAGVMLERLWKRY